MGRKPTKPIPYGINQADLVEAIRKRHVEDSTRLPEKDNLLSLIEYVARHVDDLASTSDRHQERIDAIYLARLLELTVIGLKLRIHQGGLDDDMTNTQLGEAEGLRTPPALGGRMRSYRQRLDAARHHMTVKEHLENEQTELQPVQRPANLFEATRHLLKHIDARDADCPHPVDTEVMESVRNITHTLQGSTPRQAHSVKQQLAWLVEELDAAAQNRGGAMGMEPTTCALRHAREWLSQ